MSEKGLEDEAKAGLELSGIWPAAVSNGEAKIEENTLELEQLDVELSSASMTESSEGETGKTAVIRQIKVNSTRPGSDKEGRKSDDEKLYVVGNFSVCCGYSETMDDREFADEGIYQGLVMTDTQKKELGILPEAIYMTIKLIEKGALIESLALSAAASAIEVAEASPSTNLSPIFDKQDMNLIGLDNPRPRSCLTFTRGSLPQRQRLRKQPVRKIIPRYRDLILRPPPLPPIEPGSTIAERKVHAVVESLLRSEAAYLTSLHIAIKVYFIPLHELAGGPSPVLSLEEVLCIFGPIQDILRFQEVFYSAITTRTLDWKPQQKIGDVLSSLSNRDVVNNYSIYVNNFTQAMTTLEKAINKKPKFVRFLKEKYVVSRTSLSLQGLLLKPIQRFPQYILFLQDLLKFTCLGHPDRVTLQLALAHYEGITNFLNEHKRQREQLVVVQNLTNKISHLPFKLMDGKRWLHRQDIVTRLLMNNGQLVMKDRCLLLFSNMILCAAMRWRKKKGQRAKKVELESTTGSRNFESMNDFVYSCKWYCPLGKLEVIEPDYLNDIWDRRDNNASNYLELKEHYNKLEQDFMQMSHIATMSATLHGDYKGLKVPDLATHVRVLQRKIAMVKKDLKALQQGRMDIQLPTRDGEKKVCHTYIFKSDKIRQNWVNILRYSKHKLKHPVASSWVIAEDVSDGGIFEVSYKLPLFVESYNLNLINNEVMSVQCATKVGRSSAWLASGDNSSAHISIVECVTPSPIMLECFKVNSMRILDILYVPPSSFCLAESEYAQDTITMQQQRRLSKGSVQGAATLTVIPSYLATVWMGAQCGKLSIFSADSAGDGSKQCLSRIMLKDAITTIQYYQDQVFVTTAERDVIIFKRLLSGFNLSLYKTVHILPGVRMSIRCSCKVGNKLWLGIGGSSHIFNMQTLQLEGVLQMSKSDGVMINKMVSQGEGIWVSYRGSSSLELFHTPSKQSLQNIDIKTSINTIIKRRKLENRLPPPSCIHVTAIMASHGYLWIGTSEGCMLVYHIPHLDTIPIVSGKPYLAMDSHRGAVRVLLPVHTGGTVESTRVKQFEDDEDHRRSMLLGKEEMMSLSHVLKDGPDTRARFGRSISEPLEMMCRSERTDPLMLDNGESPSNFQYANTTDPCSSSSALYVNTTKPADDVRIEQSISPDPSMSLWTGASEVGEAEAAQEKAAAGKKMEEHQNTTDWGKLDEEEDNGNVKEGDVRKKVEREHVGKEEKGDTVRKKEEERNRQKEGERDEESRHREGEREEESRHREGERKEESRHREGEREEESRLREGEREEESRHREGEREERDVNGMENDERSDDDYNSDELASMARFKNGIHSSPSTQNRDGFINWEESTSQLSLQPISLLALESLRDSGDYTIPLELDNIKNSAIGERYRNGNPPLIPVGGEVTAIDTESRFSTYYKQDSVNSEEQWYCAGGKDGADNDPMALDTRERLLVARRANGLGVDEDGSYEFPTELARSVLNDRVHPYEDPATLGKDISTPLSALYSTKTLNRSLLYFQPQRSLTEEGGMFVLTAGKGMRNLRFSRKTPVVNLANKEAEGCMIAYEVEV